MGESRAVMRVGLEVVFTPVASSLKTILSITDSFLSQYEIMANTQVRANSWSVTINNPVASDEENIAHARQEGWKVEGQKEVGENGTPHYQLLVKTPQIRFSQIKKAFPRAHIEIARNVKALEQYVTKEETRVGQLASASELYPSLQKVWDMFYDYLVEKKMTKLELVKMNQTKWLSNFDNFVCKMIEKGYVIETLAVNPQIRSAVKNYGASIFIRSEIRRQTDRQTDEKNVALDNITNAQDDEESISQEGEGEEVYEESESGEE